jgi:hypothetical protein
MKLAVNGDLPLAAVNVVTIMFPKLENARKQLAIRAAALGPQLFPIINRKN